MQTTENTKAYIIGSGIAALATAFYLERDAKILGKNIHILEKDSVVGGACDGSGDAQRGYLIRGGRMHEKHYVCYWDLLSNIPSLEDPNISVTEESFAFNEKYVSNAKARLLEKGEKVDLSSYGLSAKQQADLVKLTFVPEMMLDNKRIEDWFDHDFFETNFWYIWTTMFAFQKWSSVAEMRRYMKRFIHLVDGLYRLGGVLRTKYNQYDSVIRPMRRYLEAKGVQFDMNSCVEDIEFDIAADRVRASLVHMSDKEEIRLGDEDYLFITNGSITESSDVGSWHKAPVLKGVEESASWKLWKKIAKKHHLFGNPSVFCDNVDLQKWYSFTVTLKDSTFHDYMESFTGNVDGTGGLVTFKDSNWLMSIVIAHQPHFANQSDDVKIFWGYGLYVDHKGNFVDKTMAECSGEEILEEVFGHLKIQEMMEPIIAARKVNCLPVAMPFIDSLFMPREQGDRPDVIPKGASNFAFLGQFAEVDKDCVFTVEYSVRTAQMAVYGLFETDKEVFPVYDSIHQPKYLIAAMKALSR